MKFLRDNIFARYEMPQLIINDQGTHFDYSSFDALLIRHFILYRLITPKPQTNGQVEVFNRQMKQYLEKTVNKNKKD